MWEWGSFLVALAQISILAVFIIIIMLVAFGLAKAIREGMK